MEYLDYYDDNGNYLGFKTRKEVHEKGLWHKTIHCWLYDELGNIYFQIRKDTNTFYTTASGHVQKGETLQEAFKREIMEVIGLDIDSSDAILIDVIPFKMDKLKDGVLLKDRAMAHVYLDLFEGSYEDFNFDSLEVLGVVKVNAKDTLSLFKKGRGQIEAEIFKQNEVIKRKVDFDEFLVNEHETAINKYGKILEKVISITN